MRVEALIARKGKLKSFFACYYFFVLFEALLSRLQQLLVAFFIYVVDLVVFFKVSLVFQQ